MGYYIHYGEKVVRTEFSNRSVKRKRPMIPWFVLGFLVFACLVVFLMYNEILIPGDPSVTKRAGEAFIYRLKDGDGIRNAVYTFCKVIVSNEVF